MQPVVGVCTTTEGLYYLKMKKKYLHHYILLPLSWIYGLIIFLRNKSFDLGILKEKKFPIPIISVGNITVGGTGKTPHIEYLIRLLEKDFKLALLSRGYKRKSKGFILADDLSDAEMIGDEPCQIKKKFPHIIVAVDADRRNGITKIIGSFKDIDLILLDDAYQHRYVKPGLNILLIDFNRPISRDFLLPSGQLREPVSAIKRADMVLITKSPENFTSSKQVEFVHNLNIKLLNKTYFTIVSGDMLLPVFKDNNDINISSLYNSKPSVLLVSGIANPKALKQMIMNISHLITEMHFPDHHFFTSKDISNIKLAFEQMRGTEKILITTEKDAVRFQKFSNLPPELKNRMFYVPIKIEFLNGDAENFNNHIINYVRENKRNSNIY